MCMSFSIRSSKSVAREPKDARKTHIDMQRREETVHLDAFKHQRGLPWLLLINERPLCDKPDSTTQYFACAFLAHAYGHEEYGRTRYKIILRSEEIDMANHLDGGHLNPDVAERAQRHSRHLQRERATAAAGGDVPPSQAPHPTTNSAANNGRYSDGRHNQYVDPGAVDDQTQAGSQRIGGRARQHRQDGGERQTLAIRSTTSRSTRHQQDRDRLRQNLRDRRSGSSS